MNQSQPTHTPPRARASNHWASVMFEHRHQSHLLFALLMALLLALPVFGLVARPLASGEGDSRSIEKNAFAAQVTRMESSWTSGLIRTAYLFHPDLSRLDIQAEVSGTQAALHGAVPTPAHKQLAEDIALRVNGINDVENGLLVDGTAGALALDSPVLTVTDAAISTRIQSQLLVNTETSGLEIQVATNGRVVVLSGEVDSNSARRAAYEIASNTGGVQRVIDRLVVRPEV